MTLSPTRGSPEPLAQRPVLVLTLAFWAMVYAILSVRALFVEAPYWAQVIPRLVNCAFGAALCLLFYRVIRSQMHRPLRVLVVMGLIGSLLGGMAYALFSPWMFDHFLDLQTTSEPSLYNWTMDLVLGAQSYLWVFLSWCFGFLAFAYSERSRVNELRAVEAQALAADAQNRMLLYQINPHFLFNTLNTLSSFVLEKKSDKAEETLLSLSEFLRYSLTRSPDEMAPLRQEAAAQEDYLNIERARFGDRVRFVVEVAPDVADAPMPSLILQPLVENAVKYAVSATNRPVTIELIGRRERDNAVITVRDDGPGPTPGRSGLGVGLENVRRRLQLAYGDRATFRHGPREGGAGYVVVLTVPLAGGPGKADASA